MRKPVLAAAAAVMISALLAASDSGEAFMPRLVRLEAAGAVPEMAPLLAAEPVAVNAVLLQYAGDTVLRLNAHLALLRHRGMAREVLATYGLEPEFKEILARHGPAVIPPIAYFTHHDVGSLSVMHAAGGALEEAKQMALQLWDLALGNPATVRERPPVSFDPMPAERGWYAIAFIREEGHDFLGQFVVGDGGEVDWVQSERVTEAASAFFTGGVRTLEARYRIGEDPDAVDWLWAGVDVALVAGAAKVLRAGRAAAGGARAAGSARAALAMRATVRAGRTALRVGRYGVPVAVAYAVVRHPSLISGLAAQAAHLLGLPVRLVQAVTWFAVLLPLLLAAGWVTRGLIAPALGVLRTATRGLMWMQRLVMRAPAVGSDGPADLKR